MSRIAENLPPDFGDEAINAALKVAYVDGVKQGFAFVLDELQTKYMNPEVMPMSTEAEAILQVTKFLGGKIRDEQGTLAKL